MSLTEDYLLNIQPRIHDAIENHLNIRAYRSLKELIDKKAWEVVYSYQASAWAMGSRRYEIGDADALSASVQGNELTIRNTTHLQGGDEYETDIVQNGYANYRQPYPRPFMEEALAEYIESGQAEEDLAQSMEEAGFDVVRR